jgi:hypothetical protein
MRWYVLRVCRIPLTCSDRSARPSWARTHNIMQAYLAVALCLWLALGSVFLTGLLLTVYDIAFGFTFVWSVRQPPIPAVACRHGPPARVYI